MLPSALTRKVKIQLIPREFLPCPSLGVAGLWRSLFFLCLRDDTGEEALPGKWLFRDARKPGTEHVPGIGLLWMPLLQSFALTVNATNRNRLLGLARRAVLLVSRSRRRRVGLFVSSRHRRLGSSENSHIQTERGGQRQRCLARFVKHGGGRDVA